MGPGGMTQLEVGEPLNEKFNDLFSVPDIIGVIKKEGMGADLHKFLQKYREL